MDVFVCNYYRSDKDRQTASQSVRFALRQTSYKHLLRFEQIPPFSESQRLYNFSDVFRKSATAGGQNGGLKDGILRGGLETELLACVGQYLTRTLLIMLVQTVFLYYACGMCFGGTALAFLA